MTDVSPSGKRSLGVAVSLGPVSGTDCRASSERVRIASELSAGLLMDLDSSEVTPETEGMEKLVPAVKKLADRLEALGIQGADRS